MERVFMIADVRGYTRFTREHGDAAAALLATRFAELAHDAVEARSGRVIELRGDEALAVFESASQAVRAAVELTAVCLDTAAEDESLPLFVGVGIDLGEAVPVEGGFRGAALNTAARLCSKAAGGQVLATAGLAERAGRIPGVELVPAGAAELKGFEAPVDLIEAVLGPRPRPPRDPTARQEPLPLELRPDLPLVGRTHELAWARGTWRQVERGFGRVLVVSGLSGMGKTRLAAEIAVFAQDCGAQVVYSGAGGTAAADAISALKESVSAAGPWFVVVDDLDASSAAVLPALETLLPEIALRPTLVLCLLQDAEAGGDVEKLLALVDAASDGHRRLGSLDADEVAAIARVYAGDEVVSVPLESIARGSGGVPARVHELMSDWAEREATRRLAEIGRAHV